jgi:vacuolar-type H+-ATPase subunit H
MEMAKTINARMLKRRGACAEQYKLFLKYYGSRHNVEVTEEEAMKHAHEFDWNWAAKKFLNDNQWKLYDEAMEEPGKIYEEAIAEPLKLYDEAIKEAWKIYEEAIAEPWKLYNEAIAEPQEVYEEAMDEAQKLYDEAQARAFVKAYNS